MLGACKSAKRARYDRSAHSAKECLGNVHLQNVHTINALPNHLHAGCTHASEFSSPLWPAGEPDSWNYWWSYSGVSGE